MRNNKNKGKNSKLQKFFSNYNLINLKDEEIIIYPDDGEDHAYYLESGFVREYCVSAKGTELTIHIFAPDSYFPAFQYVSQLKNRYFFETITKCIVRKIPQTELNKFINDNPEILFDLTKKMLEGLDKILERIEQLAFNSAYQRVVSTLIYLSRHFGIERKSNELLIDHNFKHIDISQLACTSRETTTRELEKLKRNGIIKREENKILILDFPKLEAQLDPISSSN